MSHFVFCFYSMGQTSIHKTKETSVRHLFKKNEIPKALTSSLILSKIDSNKQLLILDVCSLYVFMCLSQCIVSHKMQQPLKDVGYEYSCMYYERQNIILCPVCYSLSVRLSFAEVML